MKELVARVRLAIAAIICIQEWWWLISVAFTITFKSVMYWLLANWVEQLAEPPYNPWVTWANNNYLVFVVLLGLYVGVLLKSCLLYTSPSPRDQRGSRMPSSA